MSVHAVQRPTRILVDLDRIAGKRDVLVGHIQEQYGIAQEEAEKQVKEWEETNKLDS